MSRTIFEFNRGDKIKRVAPARSYESGIRDNSYIGVDMIFMGVEDGVILLRKCEDNWPLKLNIKYWFDDWTPCGEIDNSCVISKDTLLEMNKDLNELLSQVQAMMNCWEEASFVCPIEYHQREIYTKIKRKHNL
jgi:hypothetical protein